METELFESKRMAEIENDIRAIKRLLEIESNIRNRTHWCNRKEVGEQLGVCLKTVDNYIKAGLLPYTKFAGKVYIKLEDLDNVLEKNYVPAKSR